MKPKILKWANEYWVTGTFLVLSSINSAQASESHVETQKPEDFAYGLDIDAPSGGPVYKLNLPEDVYRVVKKPDLADLRVFNSQGNVLPHSLQYLAFEERQSALRQPLLAFPIEGNPSDQSLENALVVREDALGKVVNVRFSGQSQGKDNRPLAYLVDLRKQEHPLKSLDFEWSTTEANRVIPIQLEASEDLKYWHSISSGAVLAKLAYQGEKLEQKRIDFPELRTRFLKIRWAKTLPFKIEALTGEFSTGERIEAQSSWSKVSGQIQPSKKNVPSDASKMQFIFDTQAAYPVHSIKINLPDPNTFLQIRLASATSEDGPWSERAAGTVYRVAIDGKELVSQPMEVGNPRPDRYWLLTVEGKDAGLAGKIPELEMGWIPHQLLFLARGAGPFRLAYGSATADAIDSGFVSLMDSLKAARNGQTVAPQMAQWMAGRKELGGQKRLISPPEVRPTPWKKWALWAVLGFSVLLLSGMAWRLYRDLSVKP